VAGQGNGKINLCRGPSFQLALIFIIFVTQNTKHKIQDKKGFSVIELVIGVTVFSIVVSLSLGLFGSVLQGQRAAFAIQEVQNNVRFAFELMAKEMRTGEDFSLNSPQEISFTNSDGVDIIYRLNGTALERSDSGGSGFLPVTSDEIKVLALKFDLRLTVPGPVRPGQPFITIHMRVQGAGARPEELINIDLETSVSQRRLVEGA
jgi:prepilin-type N-terminal cleavage/methylation domain-containing protein